MNVSLSRWELQTLKVQIREEISFKRRCLRTLNLSYDDRLSCIADIDRLIALQEKIDFAYNKRNRLDMTKYEDLKKYRARIERLKKIKEKQENENRTF